MVVYALRQIFVVPLSLKLMPTFVLGKLLAALSNLELVLLFMHCDILSLLRLKLELIPVFLANKFL